MKGKFVLISGTVSETQDMLNEMSKKEYVKVVSTAVDNHGVVITTLYVKPLTIESNVKRPKK